MISKEKVRTSLTTNKAWQIKLEVEGNKSQPLNLPNSLINVQKYLEDNREKLPKGNCAYMNKSDFYFMIKPVLTAGH